MKNFKFIKEERRRIAALARDGAPDKKGVYHSKSKGTHVQMKHGLAYVRVILNTVEEFNPDMFIELGTFMGGFTLALHEKFPKLDIRSFDVDIRCDTGLFGNTVKFYRENLLNGESQKLVRILKLHKSRKKILYCDNGNKIYEMNTYGKYLAVGDLIGCHDWMFEVGPYDIEELILKFAPHDHYTYIEEGLWTRFWLKVKN